jgi:hypothetical protein
MKAAGAVLNVVLCLWAAAASAEVKLHCTFDDEAAIAKPAAAAVEGAMSTWTTGAGKILYEDGLVGKAARLHGNQRNNEIIKISPKALDFTKSGRMDFWIRFNADPHKVKEEYYIFCDSAWPINFQMEVIPYDRPNNEKGEACYGTWLGARERGRDKLLYNWSSDRFHKGGPFSRIKQGEWVRITLVWIKNDGKDDELKTFINGETVPGTPQGAMLTDVTGKLPAPTDKVGNIHIGGNAYGAYTSDFTIDELWVFDDPEDSPEKRGFKPPTPKETPKP